MHKLIAITGMGGSGKSTVLTNLACIFARERLLVGCFSCDFRYASLLLFFKGLEIPPEKSIGKLFDHKSPQTQFVEHPQMKNLFLSSTAFCECCLEYEPPDKQAIDQFLENVSGAFDVVFVECPDVQLNQFSARVVLSCDELINVVNPTVQGIAWEKNFRPLLRQLRPDVMSHQVMNADKGHLDRVEVLQHIGASDIELPYLQEVEQSINSGVPVCAADEYVPRIRLYAAGIERLKQRLMKGWGGV